MTGLPRARGTTSGIIISPNGSESYLANSQDGRSDLVPTPDDINLFEKETDSSSGTLTTPPTNPEADGVTLPSNESIPSADKGTTEFSDVQEKRNMLYQVDRLREAGIEVITDADEAQLDMNRALEARKNKGKKEHWKPSPLLQKKNIYKPSFQVLTVQR